MNGYQRGEVYEHIENPTSSASTDSKEVSDGKFKKVIDKIKDTTGKIKSKSLSELGILDATQIEKKLKQSTVKLTFKINDSGGKGQEAHCTGVYFKKIPTRYTKNGVKRMSGIAFPTGCLLSKMPTQGSTLDKIEIHPAGITDKLITINPKEDFRLGSKTNIYFHKIKEGTAYKDYLEKQEGAIAFLRIESDEYHQKFKDKVTPWHLGHMSCFSGGEYNSSQYVNIFAMTSTQGNPFEIKYAKIANAISWEKIKTKEHIVTIAGSSPDDNSIAEDNNYDDGGPVVECTENGSRCGLLGFALTKSHFPELYNNGSTGTKIALLHNAELGSESGMSGRINQVAGDATMKTSTVAGAVTGSVIGLVVGAPFFIGNVIAQEFGYKGNTSENMGAAALATGPKVGRLAGEALGTGINKSVEIGKEVGRKIVKRIKNEKVPASDDVNFQEDVKSFQKNR